MAASESLGGQFDHLISTEVEDTPYKGKYRWYTNMSPRHPSSGSVGKQVLDRDEEGGLSAREGWYIPGNVDPLKPFHESDPAVPNIPFIGDDFDYSGHIINPVFESNIFNARLPKPMYRVSADILRDHMPEQDPDTGALLGTPKAASIFVSGTESTQHRARIAAESMKRRMAEGRDLRTGRPRNS